MLHNFQRHVPISVLTPLQQHVPISVLTPLQRHVPISVLTPLQQHVPNGVLTPLQQHVPFVCADTPPTARTNWCADSPSCHDKRLPRNISRCQWYNAVMAGSFSRDIQICILLNLPPDSSFLPRAFHCSLLIKHLKPVETLPN
ncbi:hypothetical protein BsWGS_03163 [Bradybaena similaris]